MKVTAPIGEVLAALQRCAEKEPDARVSVWEHSGERGDGILEIEDARGKPLWCILISVGSEGSVRVRGEK